MATQLVDTMHNVLAINQLYDPGLTSHTHFLVLLFILEIKILVTNQSLYFFSKQIFTLQSPQTKSLSEILKSFKYKRDE